MLNASDPIKGGLFVPNLEVGRKHSTFFSGEGFQLKVILNYTSVMPVLQTTGSCNFVFHSKKKKGLGFYTPSIEVTCLLEGGNTLFSVGYQQACLYTRGFILFIFVQSSEFTAALY